MIIVRVELLSAITGKTTELARMHIINDGSGTATKGNYAATTFRGRSSEDLDLCNVSKHALVRNWSRQAFHVWNLVRKALEELGYTKG